MLEDGLGITVAVSLIAKDPKEIEAAGWQKLWLDDTHEVGHSMILFVPISHYQDRMPFMYSLRSVWLKRFINFGVHNDCLSLITRYSMIEEITPKAKWKAKFGISTFLNR